MSDSWVTREYSWVLMSHVLICSFTHESCALLLIYSWVMCSSAHFTRMPVAYKRSLYIKIKIITKKKKSRSRKISEFIQLLVWSSPVIAHTVAHFTTSVVALELQMWESKLVGLEENFVGPEGNFVGPEDTWLKLRRRGGKQVGPAKKTLYTSTKYVGGSWP